MPDALLRRGALTSWAIIVTGWLLTFLVPLGVIWFSFGGWAWPWVRVVLCGLVVIPCFFVALIWWLAISVSVGVKCPACGDVLHEQVMDVGHDRGRGAAALWQLPGGGGGGEVKRWGH